MEPLAGRARMADYTAPVLDELYFYLTEGCNLACCHCWLAPRLDPAGEKYPSLPVELFETAISEAERLGLRRVKLTGGEPLLHPDFERLLEIVRRAGLGLTMETNGVLCTPHLATEMARCFQPFVSVSIDGADAETHEEIRGVPGSFEAATRAVGELAAAGLEPQIIFTVMRSNTHQLDDVVGMAERLGAGSVKFNVVQPTARGERLHRDGQTPGIGELIDLGRRVEQVIAPESDLTVVFDLPLAFHSLRLVATGDGCGVCGIKHILGVLPSGHYALCGIGEKVPELVFGQVGVDELEVIWREHPVVLALREGLPDRLTGVCSRCLMRHCCLGTCIAQNYYSSGDLWEPYWFCDQAEKEGLFPISRLATA